MSEEHFGILGVFKIENVENEYSVKYFDKRTVLHNLASI